MENQNLKKRERVDSLDSGDSEPGAPEVKRLREDLLGFLDESDPEPVTQDLDSLMKSFEEEISTASPAPVIDLTSDSGESQPELGYLFEASDDELGLPPSSSIAVNRREERGEVSEIVRVSSDSSGIGDLWRFEDAIPNYDAFELEARDVYSSNTAEYVAFDGLFEYTNLYYDASDNSDLLWRQETLPAQ